jgi:general secretion pathway protein D
MQVNRDKSRTLGISPPTSGSVTLQNNLNSTTTTTPGSTVGTPVTTTSGSTPNTISLNSIGNLNATDFSVTISQATATAVMSDSSSKLIQKPQIRAIEGQKASLKIGQRVPVATGSFQPGIGGVGINPLVNTQFQYIDVGVNIDITPRIHANGDVTLKMTMEVSEVDTQSNIGGISQPVIGQRKIEQEVRLKEGEVNLLGGMMEDQRTQALSGFPLLSQIPILKYLFSQDNRDHSETETVFVLIPHIVRRQDISEMNQEALDVGTASSIELHRASRPQSPSTGDNATPAPPAPQMPAGTQRPAQPALPPPGSASFSFDPPAITQPHGSTFTVNVQVAGAQNAYSVPLQVTYDPKMLQVVNVSNGTFLSQDGQAVALVHRDDDSSGTLQITATRPPGASGISGQGTIVTLTFMAKTAGQSTLAISKGGTRDPNMQPTLVAGATAAVTIQ